MKNTEMNLNTMNKANLQEVAKSMNIDFTSKTTKTQLIEAIVSYVEAQPKADEPAPAVDETPAVDESPAVDEAPAVDETPGQTDEPKADEPKAEKPSKAKEPKISNYDQIRLYLPDSFTIKTVAPNKCYIDNADHKHVIAISGANKLRIFYPESFETAFTPYITDAVASTEIYLKKKGRKLTRNAFINTDLLCTFLTQLASLIAPAVENAPAEK